MYQKILVPLDGSELAECVLPHVESIAKGCNAGSVAFIRVAEPVHMPVSSEYDGYIFSAEDWRRMEAESRAAAERYLTGLMSRVKYDGVNITAEVLTGGRAAEMITEYAAKNGVDLITIATHGRSGISRWVWGSVADRVLRSSTVPVLMVRAPGCLPGSI
ncbi:MAG: universal stress protein [Chloroflexi bacterium]|nr:universal stress protein [Chloroflexota bacterium]MBI3040597.1 universal stress protein [Chloroflexota bacterium]